MPKIRNERTIINGYKVPAGQGGNAIRFMVEEILKSPRKALPMKQLFEDACEMAPLNQSTASWLTSESENRTPVGHVFERFKDENHKYLQLRLLPGAEILNGTYVNPFKASKNQTMSDIQCKGVEKGAIVGLHHYYLDNKEMKTALVLDIVETKKEILLQCLIENYHQQIRIESVTARIS